MHPCSLYLAHPRHDLNVVVFIYPMERGIIRVETSESLTWLSYIKHVLVLDFS